MAIQPRLANLEQGLYLKGGGSEEDISDLVEVHLKDCQEATLEGRSVKPIALINCTMSAACFQMLRRLPKLGRLLLLRCTVNFYEPRVLTGTFGYIGVEDLFKVPIMTRLKMEKYVEIPKDQLDVEKPLYEQEQVLNVNLLGLKHFVWAYLYSTRQPRDDTADEVNAMYMCATDALNKVLQHLWTKESPFALTKSDLSSIRSILKEHCDGWFFLYKGKFVPPKEFDVAPASPSSSCSKEEIRTIMDQLPDGNSIASIPACESFWNDVFRE